MTTVKLMKSTKVKPCPFCGKIPMIQRGVRFPNYVAVTSYEVVCCSSPSECIISCGDNRWYRRKKDAIDAWNTRRGEEKI